MLALGADTDQLRSLSGALGDAAHRLEELFAALRDHASRATWVGADAQAFRIELEQVCLHGTSVAEQVDTRGHQLEKEADEQDSASSLAAGSLPHGLGVWNLPHLPGPWKLPHGPLPSWRVPLPKGIGLDPLETLDTASDVQRQLDSIRHQDSMKSMLGPGGKRLLKFLPVLGAVPDGVEAGQALVDGDTGAVIGNLYEAGVAAVPHPITATISLANDIGDLALPGDSSPLEHLGEIAAHGDRARMGEMVGGTISDYLGYEDGSLVDNMLTAGLGTVGHLSSLTPPGAAVESASAVRNWAAETW